MVLACRVSPKQKADIVNMIRARFPSKVTLSIGDGANDVNMILQAHVGVGILGKEGQQAARSADYAIGQFKFLKPLMFVHGREAYRRNAFLVKYTFYKNILYVSTNYFLGFWSAFSSQLMYEKYIYILWNITMTSLPIMYFALFDFEYEKGEEDGGVSEELQRDGSAGRLLSEAGAEDELVRKTFMKDPLLYRIGIERQCYTMRQYVAWIFYGIF